LAILKGLIIILFIVMVVLVFGQVFVRYVLHSSFTWSEELSRFCMVWMVFLSAVIVFNSNNHIMVDALITYVKGVTRTVFLILSKIAVLVFSIFITIGASQFLPTVSIQTSPANRINMSYVYAVIPISMACIGVLCLRDILLLVKEAASGRNKADKEAAE